MVRSVDISSQPPGAESGRGGSKRRPFSLDPSVLEREIRVDTFRASGPGGQNLHKTESAVRITHLPSGVVVTASDTRSQSRNRAIALERLVVRLRRLNTVPKKRTATRPTRSSVRRRLEQKRRNAEAKGLRARVRSRD
ncbi:MAG: peptide chain release factor-like protein [Acidiferrobacterales bacterium]